MRRNLGGLILGAVDTTSKFATQAIDELLLIDGCSEPAEWVGLVLYLPL